MLMVTCGVVPRDIEMGVKTGFFRYLTKPIKENEFMDALHLALELAEKPVSQSK